MSQAEPVNETAELTYDDLRMRWSGTYRGRSLTHEGPLVDSGKIHLIFARQIREAGGVLVGGHREPGESVSSQKIILHILRIMYQVDISVAETDGEHYTFERDIAAVDRALRALSNSRVLTFQDRDNTTVAVPVSSILDVRITPALPDGPDII